MIPKVRTWRVRVLAFTMQDGKVLPEENFFETAPTKTLVRIGFRLDYPRFWGREIKISLAKSQG